MSLIAPFFPEVFNMRWTKKREIIGERKIQHNTHLYRRFAKAIIVVSEVLTGVNGESFSRTTS